MEGVPSRLRFYLSRRQDRCRRHLLSFVTQAGFAPSSFRLGLPVRRVPSEPCAAPFAGRLYTGGLLPRLDFLFLFLPLSQKNGPTDGKSAGRLLRDEAPPPRILVWNGIESPVWASEMDRAPAKLCYETGIEREIPRGLCPVDDLPTVTGVASGIMSGSRFLPARCIGRRFYVTSQRKNQAFFWEPHVLNPVQSRAGQ